MIGARLQDSRLMRPFQIKKAQGHANVIVEAGLGSEGGEPRFEQGCQQLLGGCLAVGSGHAEHGQREPVSVGRGDTPQGLSGISHGDGWHSLGNLRQTILRDHNGGGRLQFGVFEKIVPIKPFAAQGHKQIARPKVSRVGANPGNLQAASLGGMEGPLGGFGDELECHRFHYFNA